jgi:hypothetical protein
VTATDTGLLDAPAADIWIVPVYVPAVKPEGFTNTDTVAGVFALFQEAASQFPPEAVPTVPVSARTLPPLFVIWIDCAAGTAPPTE